MNDKAKIFGIGLSRTGTTSLHVLLQALGYTSRHFDRSLMADPDAEVTTDAVSDSPVPLLYRDLDRRYPQSKFILTTRDKGAWLGSMKWMFEDGRIIWNWAPATHAYHARLYGTTTYDERTLSNRWDSFHEEARAYFANRPHDLLVLDIGGAIRVSEVCSFLGVPARDIAFPKENCRRRLGLVERTARSLSNLFGR